MSVTLQQLVEAARETAERDRRRLPEAELCARLRNRPAQRPGRLRQALSAQGLAIIAEVKAASPVDGTLCAELRPVPLACAYAAAGASAVSVLTEERYFGGSIEHLEAVAEALSVPVLRKDFIVEPYQVRQAAVAGAAAVLLIAEAIAPEQLQQLVSVAHELGLDALVEVHDLASLGVAVAAGSGLIGVNNRNLHTMQVDWRHCLDLASSLPEAVVTVAESGLSEVGQLRRVAEAGYDAVLIGSSLVRSPDPGAALAALRAQEA